MDLLSNVLFQSRLTGGMYFCNMFEKNWALNFDETNIGVFHIMIDGHASLGFGNKIIKIKSGDIIAFPKGKAHWIGHNESNTRVSLDDFIYEHNNSPMAMIDENKVACTLLSGHFNFSDPTHFPFFKGLPDFLRIPSQNVKAYNWLMELVKKMNLETLNRNIGSDLFLNRQIELLFVELIRYWLSTDKINNVLLKATSNPNIFKALSLFHTSPENNFTLDEVAKDIGMSRANFTKKFTEIIGIAPIFYLTKLRIHIACNLLASTNLTVMEIALKVGYQTDSALSKMFKSELNVSPGFYRKQNSVLN
jgi:AraC-like DNA-binding protein